MNRARQRDTAALDGGWYLLVPQLSGKLMHPLLHVGHCGPEVTAGVVGFALYARCRHEYHLPTLVDSLRLGAVEGDSITISPSASQVSDQLSIIDDERREGKGDSEGKSDTLSDDEDSGKRQEDHWSHTASTVRKYGMYRRCIRNI